MLILLNLCLLIRILDRYDLLSIIIFESVAVHARLLLGLDRLLIRVSLCIYALLECVVVHNNILGICLVAQGQPLRALVALLLWLAVAASAVVECLVSAAVFVHPVAVLDLLRLVELDLVMTGILDFQVLVLAHVVRLLSTVMALHRRWGGVELGRVGDASLAGGVLLTAKGARSRMRGLQWPVEVLSLARVGVSGAWVGVTAGAGLVASA